jgi:hypothetical protein
MCWWLNAPVFEDLKTVLRDPPQALLHHQPQLCLSQEPRSDCYQERHGRSERLLCSRAESQVQAPLVTDAYAVPQADDLYRPYPFSIGDMVRAAGVELARTPLYAIWVPG